MKFILIDANAQEVRGIEAEDFQAAKMRAGLKGLDFGRVTGDLHIAVYEFGLVEDPNKQKFFSINGRLYAGNAIVFRIQNDGSENSGETIDCTMSDFGEIGLACTFFDRVSQVLFAIKQGRVQRPETSINGEVIWRWPDPHPMKKDFGVA